MKKKLDLQLKLLIREDLSAFEDFVNSPYFNKLPRLVKLFQFVKKNYELISANKIFREDLSAFMYPGEPYKDASIKKLISDFNRLIERFAVQKELEEDKVNYNLNLLKQFRKNRLEDKFEKLYKDIELLNEDDRSEVDLYYENRVRLLCERFELLYHKSIKEKKDIFQKKSDMLDLEFAMKKIYLYEAMVSIETVDKKAKYNYTFLKEIDDYINLNKANIIKAEPELYRNYLQLRITTEKNNFELLKELERFTYSAYSKEKMLTPLIDLSNMFTYAGLNSAELHSHYVHKNFQIYKYIDENNFLNNVKLIKHIDFAKAIQSGLAANEFEWTKNFIDKYKNKIELEFRNDMKNYSYGRVYYELKDYNKSLFHLALVNFKDYYLYTNSKKMLIRVEYESGNYERVLSEVENIQKFYNSHIEIPGIYKIDTLNYILIMGELCRYYLKNKSESERSFKKSKLLKKLEKNKNYIVYYNWLLEKINELK